jgi:very-short-patch-repair endonuclease
MQYPTHTRSASVTQRAELLLWQRLQARQLSGFRFHHQMRIPPHRVDFVCLSRQVVVEVVEPRCLDHPRWQDLEEAGYHCLRFVPGDIVGRIDEVLASIRQALTGRTQDA